MCSSQQWVSSTLYVSSVNVPSSILQLHRGILHDLFRGIITERNEGEGDGSLSGEKDVYLHCVVVTLALLLLMMFDVCVCVCI